MSSFHFVIRHPNNIPIHSEGFMEIAITVTSGIEISTSG